ncbi:hypothetical protein BRC72_02030 [Halobacteriales archaeon QH_7_66_36]|nr:MAG: hypothetical protein BRC72_02030 [Halobacteriales archaeon QH_7_66_36]
MDPLAPFEPRAVEAVAASHECTTDELRGALRRLHEHAAATPGIDELIMEWRRFLPYDVLVARTDDAYLLAVADSIWTEFGSQIGLTDAELAALRTLHERQTERTLGARDDEDSPPTFDERAPLVLAR